MSKAIIEKMIIEETKNLSSEALNEILDFIQFIKTKKYKKLLKETFEENITTNLNELNTVSLIHLENEFANYKEKYPHE
jgi:glutaredoxin 2